MADYPALMKFFRVLGQVGRGFGDTIDVGDKPDLLPIVGAKITAIPNIDPSGQIGPVFKVATSTPPVTIWQEAIYATTDSAGRVVPADSTYAKIQNDADVDGVLLPWGGTPGIQPINWTWTITIDVGGNFKPRVFTIFGSDAGAFDLTTLVPVPVSPGTDVSNWQSVVQQVTLIRDQILAAQQAPGTGANGLSAYEVARGQGYTGTVTQWLASLKGANGLSAYDIAVANGFIGNQAAWVNSLKGTKGDAGANGTTGLSAYQEWLAAGNTGSAATFLASLKGAKGDQGIPGVAGVAGPESPASVGYRAQNTDGSYPGVGTAPVGQLLLYVGQTPPNPSVVRQPCLYWNGSFS